MTALATFARPRLVAVAAGPDQARRAATAAKALSVSLTLLSPPGASAYGGVGWFAALAALAAAELAPCAEFDWILDCGDRAGDALTALAEGCPSVIFDGSDAAAARLTGIAAARGARVLRARPAALTLRPGGDALSASRQWLRMTGQPPSGGPMLPPLFAAP